MNDSPTLAGRIRRNLFAIADHYDATLEPSRQSTGGRVTASKEPPLPVSAHILDTRADAYRDLTYWVRFLLDEVRDINDQPIQHGPTSVDVASMVPFISTWVDWLVTNMPDDADNLATEAEKHARGLRTLVEGGGARRFPIGPCIEHGTSELGERVPCPGEMTALLRQTDNLLPSEIYCTADAQHHWPAREWMQLGHRIVREFGTAM